MRGSVACRLGVELAMAAEACGMDGKGRVYRLRGAAEAKRKVDTLCILFSHAPSGLSENLLLETASRIVVLDTE